VLGGVDGILVRRRQDAHVDLDRLGRADPVKHPLLEEAQQLGLQAQVHFGDLVEEERALVRALEAALVHVHAPVNEPRSWPNSSFSSRSRGIAAQLIANERLVGPARDLVDGAATSSLPVPLSPVIITVAVVGATDSIIE
jgi:hypothetical protein